jgi:hypothetical protein
MESDAVTFIRMDDGTVVHVRMAKPRARRCTACGCLTPAAELRECDYIIGSGKTCDRLICVKCTQSPAPGKDLCPEHAQISKSREEGRDAQSPGH